MRARFVLRNIRSLTPAPPDPGPSADRGPKTEDREKHSAPDELNPLGKRPKGDFSKNYVYLI